MAKYVVVEELHLTVRVPSDLPADIDRGVRKRLGSRAFRDKLLAAVRQVAGGFPVLSAARVHLSR